MEKIIIENKIGNLIVLLEKLEIILKEYEKNSKLKEFLFYAAEKKAEEIVELAISINQELLKFKGKMSQSYYDSFIDLKLFGVFDENFLIKLANTAGFRNRLAHDYLDIDEKIAFNTMKDMLLLYKLYLQKVRKIMHTFK